MKDDRFLTSCNFVVLLNYTDYRFYYLCLRLIREKMANPYFKFKQFTVYHDQCAMKVGTDGVLLGAWCNLNGVQKVLDIGTGTGLIALMMAQRCNAQIDAIDIDESACIQAGLNVENSPFKNQISVHHAALSSFVKMQKETYDRIVSNPPYFINSLKCPDKQRNTARHTDTLSIPELLNSAATLLKQDGRFAIILPFDQKEILQGTANKAKLHLIRETTVYPTPEAEPKRILAEFGPTAVAEPIHSDLTIEIERHKYTEGYINLTKDFYLKM